MTIRASEIHRITELFEVSLRRRMEEKAEKLIPKLLDELKKEMTADAMEIVSNIQLMVARDPASMDVVLSIIFRDPDGAAK